MTALRKSFLTILKSQLRSGRIMWPVQQALKWPAVHLGSRLGRPLAGPIQGIFFTTYACNLRCQFCDLPQRHAAARSAGLRTELTREEKLGVIDDFAAIGTTAIGFTGGEPTLDPDAHELITRAVGQGIVAHLSSNGYAYRTRAETRALFDLGLSGTTISIDGASPECHNRLRGSDRSFDEVMTALDHLLAVRHEHGNKLSITTTTVITRDNYTELPQLVDLLQDLGVDQIGFMPAHDLGLDYGDSPEFTAQRGESALLEELDSAVDLLISRKRAGAPIENTEAYLQLFKLAFRGQPFPSHCYAGYNSLAVDSWGDIYPCFPWAEQRRAAGNTRDIGLADFWKSTQGNAMREEASTCRDCFWNCHAELNLMMGKSSSSPAPPAP